MQAQLHDSGCSTIVATQTPKAAIIANTMLHLNPIRQCQQTLMSHPVAAL
jgi:hypothetical protein